MYEGRVEGVVGRGSQWNITGRLMRAQNYSTGRSPGFALKLAAEWKWPSNVRQRSAEASFSTSDSFDVARRFEMFAVVRGGRIGRSGGHSVQSSGLGIVLSAEPSAV